MGWWLHNDHYQITIIMITLIMIIMIILNGWIVRGRCTMHREGTLSVCVRSWREGRECPQLSHTSKLHTHYSIYSYTLYVKNSNLCETNVLDFFSFFSISDMIRCHESLAQQMWKLGFKDVKSLARNVSTNGVQRVTCFELSVDSLSKF